MLQSGYSTGFLLAAFVFHVVYPLVTPLDLRWRVMLWLGLLPSLLAFWALKRVDESPIWLARRSPR